MAVYTNDLRLKEIATGDESGTWGTSTNTNLSLIADAFGFGTEAITTNADTHTTTIADGSADPGRSIFLKYTGTLDSACTITIGPNTVSKLWFIENATSGSQSIIIKQGSGATITIPNGQTKAIYSDGAGSGGAMVDAFAHLNVVDLTVEDDLTLTDDLTVNGDIDLEGSIDVNGTANLDVVDIDGAVDMASTLNVSGNVGIGFTSSASYPLEVQSGGAGTVLRAGTSFFSVDATGSASSPSLIFNGDSDTGFYRSAADTIKFASAGTDRITLGSSLAIDVSTSINTSVSDGTSLQLKNTSNANGSQLTFFNDSSSPADDDRLGQILFNGDDSAGNETTYVRFRAESSDVTDGSEDGKLQMSVVSGGSLVTPLQVGIDGVVVNEFSTSAQDFRVESDSNTHMLFVDGGNDSVAIGNTSGGLASESASLIVGNRTIVSEVVSSQTLFANNNYYKDGNVWKTLTANDWANVRLFSGAVQIHAGTSSTADETISNMDTTDEKVRISSSDLVINDHSGDYDVRIESDGNTHMLFVDAGNNAVGIGTSSLTEKLEVSGSINTTNQSTNFTAGSQRGFMDIVDSSKHVRIGSLQGAATPSGTEGTVELLVNGATKATIDSSGDLIVGGTSSGANDAVSLSNTGYVQAIVNGDTVGYFNRRTSDGEIIRLQKDGSTVGSIDVDSGALEITGASAINLNDGSNEIGFGTAAIAGNGSSNDAVIDLGRTNRRFKDLHLSGTANTGLLEVASANTTLANFQANVGGAGGVGVVNIKTNTSSSNGLQLVGNGSGASIAGGALAATVMNTENGPLRFGTNATETARITEAGDLCINNANSSGSSGATSKIFVKVPLSVTSNAFMCQPDTNGTTNAAIFQNSSGANAGFIQYTSTTTTYATSSDYRMKENVVALSGATDRLKQLKPSRFNFIEDADTTVDGFLAHEVQEVVPEAVTGTKDAVDADGNPDYQGIDQSKLVPLLVATIQELEARIAALESE